MEHSDKTIIKVFSSAFGILFLIIGAVMIIVSVWINVRMFSSRHVSATVSEVIETRTQTRKDYESVFYMPVYEYSDGGEVKTYTSSVSSSMPAEIGSETTLYILENGIIYEKRGTLATFFMGIVFTAIGIFFAFINVKKLQKKYDETER
ncbi:MAG: DUF3592 domain-containing protein [Oscillospiraceae bacterium]